MLSREQLLEIVNELNSRNAGRQVGFINGYKDQWFIGGYIQRDTLERQELQLHFCQGRNVGRINFNGGYTVILNVTACKSGEEVLEAFGLLDHHKRSEKEKLAALKVRLEARCPNCVNYFGRLTGNCSPSQSCGYKRIRKKRSRLAAQTNFREEEGNGISKTGNA